MWLVVNDEMWNLDNAEGIVAKGNKVRKLLSILTKTICNRVAIK